MNAVLNTISLLFTVLMSERAMGDNAEAEHLWIEHKYGGHGKMTFPDDKRLFCVFMRSRSEMYFGSTRHEDERVFLGNYNEDMRADLVTCSYGQSEGNITTSAPTYARGPQGQYYTMDHFDGYWKIDDLVSTSSASGERELYDRYNSIGKEVPFSFSEQGFCMKRFPGFADGLTRPESKSVNVTLMKYAEGTTVPVELCECEYSYGDEGRTHTIYYAEFAENDIYEIKNWNFKHDQNSTWVVWGFVETVSSK